MATVTITRDKQYKSPLRNERFAWSWLYSYRVDEGTRVTYGRRLGDLRDMLRRKYGRTVTIVEA